jgi:hypothetical protein
MLAWHRSSFVIVHDIQQDIGACAAIEDVAACHVYFKDVPFPQLTRLPCLAGVHICHRFATASGHTRLAP